MRIFTPIALAALAMPVVAQAEITTTTFGVNYIELGGYETPVSCTLRVSDNGKYAVGTDTEFIHSPILFNLETGEFEFISELQHGSSDNITPDWTMAYDVADDGTLAGAIIDPTILDPSGKRACFTPAIRTPQGEWQKLPMPSNIKYGYDYRYPEDSNFAKFISPDGKVVGGFVYYKYTAYKSNGAPYTRTVEGPIVWKLVGDEWQVFPIEYKDIHGTVFNPYNMTDDGRCFAGMAESVRGDQLPAYVLDGKVGFVAQPVLVKDPAFEDVYYEEMPESELEKDDPREPDEYWSGQATWVDQALNVYYNYSDGYGRIHYGMRNLITDENETFGTLPTCGTRGCVIGFNGAGGYGSPVAIKSKEPLSLPLGTIFNISNDGRAMGGANVVSDNGMSWNTPACLVLSESPCTEEAGVKNITINAGAVQKVGTTLTISGEFQAAELYNLSGVKVADLGATYDMSALTPGLYVVRVHTDGITVSYKVSR